jgi:hypothetical protein
LPVANARHERGRRSSPTGSGSVGTPSSVTCARMTDRRRVISRSESSKRWSMRSLLSRKPASEGWEPAADAQARIVCAVERIVSQSFGNGDIAIVGHGGTGTLLFCRLAGRPIDRRYDQPATNGGNWFAFDRASRRLLHDGWRSIDATAQGCDSDRNSVSLSSSSRERG